MQVVHLQIRHSDALQRVRDEFVAAGEPGRIPALFAEPDWPIEEAVEKLAAWSRGEMLPRGWQPCTTFLLEEDDELLGVCNLRHALDDRLRQYGGHIGYAVRPSARGRGCATILLRHALGEARELGLARVLITCSESNIASQRVIEKCGGVFSDKSFYEPEQVVTCRYWIDLA